MEFASHIDHTLLKPYATEADLARVCGEAKRYHFASVCVNPCNVAFVASQLVGSGVKTCSVIGFPFGNPTTAVKVAEAQGALSDGAGEIDMVINVGKLLEGDEAYVQREVDVYKRQLLPGAEAAPAEGPAERPGRLVPPDADAPFGRMPGDRIKIYPQLCAQASAQKLFLYHRRDAARPF